MIEAALERATDVQRHPRFVWRVPKAHIPSDRGRLAHSRFTAPALHLPLRRLDVTSGEG
jgi:hypothetical protein